MHNSERSHNEETVLVCLDEIYMPERKVERIMRRDYAQIARMRADIESGRRILPLLLSSRWEGGYNVKDGRHRIIAAKLAGEQWIEAQVG